MVTSPWDFSTLPTPPPASVSSSEAAAADDVILGEDGSDWALRFIFSDFVPGGVRYGNKVAIKYGTGTTKSNHGILRYIDQSPRSLE